jgi:hypothetical protein
MRFLGAGDDGLNGNSAGGGGGLSHQFNARTSLGGNYSYSIYSYPASSGGATQPGFTSQTAYLQFTRKLTRKLTMSASAGPQWSTSDAAGSSQGLSAYANAALMYSGQLSHASFSYSRSANGGYGVVGGSLSQSEAVSVSRTLARVWNFTATAAYTQTSGLPSGNSAPISLDTTVASGQVSRAIRRSLSAYASYTFEHQPSGDETAVDVFSGTEQVLGFGMTFSPSSIHVGSQ